MADEGSVPETDSLSSLVIRNVRTKVDLFRRIFTFKDDGFVESNEPSVPSVAGEPREDVPREAGHEERVEAQVQVEKPSNALPLEPQEWRHDGMSNLEQSVNKYIFFF